MARLIWRQQDGELFDFPLEDDSVLGRGADIECSVNTKSVSRRHARIEFRDGAFYIVDLGSTNGTRVNGTRVVKPTPLNRGDLIQLGEEMLEFDPDPVTGGSTKGALPTQPLQRPTRRGVASESGGRPFAFPQRVGKFHLYKKLGQGGMGAVFHARDLDSNREVAVKFIRSQIGNREAFLDFFHNREAVLAREVNHPNVIRVFEHGVRLQQHYIAMEYVAGANLLEVLRRRQLSPRETLEVLRQIACGLAAAHNKGVIHSDIKPANILLCESFASTGSGEEGSGLTVRSLVDDLPSGILEFDDDEDEDEDDGEGKENEERERLEPTLHQEIRRRAGVPPEEALVDPPYLPRPSESRFLLHYFERMLEGRAYFLLVEGEPGMGKDRLISEFIDEAAVLESPTEGKPRVHELDCSRIEGIPLLHRQLCPDRPARQPLLDLTNELVSFCRDDSRPIVIRVLNLGKATALVCDFVARLSQVMGERSFLLIASLDPEEILQNGSLKPLLEKLTPYTKSLYLRPLTEYQILRYIHLIYGGETANAELATDLYRLSGGNVGKLLDVLRSFFERGVLAVEESSGSLHYRPRIHEFELQEGKNLYAKYRSYGAAERNLLEQAAFIGPRFFFDVLLKALNINETSLFFLVRTLLGEGFFEEESPTWYRFTNLSFQQYMADRVSPQEGPHLHRKLSRLLQNVSVPDCAELSQLRARHFGGCREYAKAVQSLLEGAHMARNEYRVDLSREMYQEILHIYRQLAAHQTQRGEVTTVLKDWFRRDGNWYEVLGELSSEAPRAAVKIADFGISFRIADDSRGYQVEKRPALGTPRYLPPERIKGEYGGTPSDIFALGIIAYEMIVGEAPFPNLRGKKLLAANCRAPIVAPAEELLRYPEGMERLLANMLHKDPQRRWDAEQVLREIVKLQFDAAHQGRR